MIFLRRIRNYFYFRNNFNQCQSHMNRFQMYNFRYFLNFFAFLLKMLVIQKVFLSLSFLQKWTHSHIKRRTKAKTPFNGFWNLKSKSANRLSVKIEETSARIKPHIFACTTFPPFSIIQRWCVEIWLLRSKNQFTFLKSERVMCVCAILLADKLQMSGFLRVHGVYMRARPLTRHTPAHTNVTFTFTFG